MKKLILNDKDIMPHRKRKCPKCDNNITFTKLNADGQCARCCQKNGFYTRRRTARSKRTSDVKPKRFTNAKHQPNDVIPVAPTQHHNVGLKQQLEYVLDDIPINQSAIDDQPTQLDSCIEFTLPVLNLCETKIGQLDFNRLDLTTSTNTPVDSVFDCCHTVSPVANTLDSHEFVLHCLIDDDVDTSVDVANVVVPDEYVDSPSLNRSDSNSSVSSSDGLPQFGTIASISEKPKLLRTKIIQPYSISENNIPDYYSCTGLPLIRLDRDQAITTIFACTMFRESDLTLECRRNVYSLLYFHYPELTDDVYWYIIRQINVSKKAYVHYDKDLHTTIVNMGPLGILHYYNQP